MPNFLAGLVEPLTRRSVRHRPALRALVHDLRQVYAKLVIDLPHVTDDVPEASQLAAANEMTTLVDELVAMNPASAACRQIGEEW